MLPGGRDADRRGISAQSAPGREIRIMAWRLRSKTHASPSHPPVRKAEGHREFLGSAARASVSAEGLAIRPESDEIRLDRIEGPDGAVAQHLEVLYDGEGFGAAQYFDGRRAQFERGARVAGRRPVTAREERGSEESRDA